jgi:uncharacterized protein YfaS (alpha-2-macroglobulin family)
MLAAAYAVSGSPDKARQVLPPSFSGEKAVQVMGGNFYSYIRDQALALFALLEINPNDPQVGTLARMLSENVFKERYLNTQENVFTILAFGKIARAAAKTDATAEVLADGKVIATTKGQLVNIDLKSMPGNNFQVRVKGKGSYYYFAELSGISATGTVKEEDSYMKVRRSYYTRDGKQVSGNSFKQNDLVVVKLSIESPHNVENVVLTDILPAGFEVENARLYELPEIKWASDNTVPDYLDIRDDRVNMFTNIGSKPKNFYYMVRAVSPGVFQLGPVQADAMYNGAYHSYNGAGVIRVSEN